eukprot:scaffold35047_cov18-Tisochrysis_lutea.AAC.1
MPAISMKPAALMQHTGESGRTRVSKHFIEGFYKSESQATAYHVRFCNDCLLGDKNEHFGQNAEMCVLSVAMLFEGLQNKHQYVVHA